MSTYLFAGSLYRNEHEMLDAIAHDWLSCSGDTSEDEQRDILAQSSDDDLTVDCVSGWNLNKPADPHDYDSPSHMVTHAYTAQNLEAAFGRLRAKLVAEAA